jgi:hypothetical protein
MHTLNLNLEHWDIVEADAEFAFDYSSIDINTLVDMFEDDNSTGDDGALWVFDGISNGSARSAWKAS